MNNSEIIEIILSLVRSKNKSLNSLKDASLKVAELSVDSLLEDSQIIESYQQNREATLKAIDLYDRKIGEHISKLDQNLKDQKFIEKIRDEMLAYEKTLTLLFQQDEIIFKKIEHASKKILLHLQENKKTQITKIKKQINSNGPNFKIQAVY